MNILGQYLDAHTAQAADQTGIQGESESRERHAWNQVGWQAFGWKPPGATPIQPVRGAAVATYARCLMVQERARMRRGPTSLPARKRT